MSFANGSLIPSLSYTQSSPAPSTATIPQLHHQQQSDQRRGEFPAVVNMEISISQSKQPQFLKFIDDLAAFSAAVDAFKRQYDDLQKHMDYIDNAINSNLEGIGIDSSFHSSSPLLSPTPQNDPSGEITAPQESTEIVPETSNKPEAQRLCELMCSKGLRRYLYTNISDRAKLIEEIPAALKFAREPAKFVLECIGKFYVQGRKAYSHDSTIIPARQVSLLILESFLLMSDPGDEDKKKIENSVKDDAETAAVAWKKRLTSEGGLAAAEEMDARGLLLLISCFGVPSDFRSMDLFNLIRQSGTPEILCALKRSPFLVPMIPGIVESSSKRGMHIEALEMVYTFGMEDKFSASSVLTPFLKMSKGSFESEIQKAKSPMAFKEAIQKQLSALLSVMQCLERHKLDPAKELPGFQIKDELAKLEKDILQLDKRMEEEARSISLMEEALFTKRLYNQQLKRPRFSEMEMPPASSSSYSPIYRDQSFPIHRDGDRDEISALVSSYLGPSSSFPHRSSLRRSPEYMVAPGGLGRSLSAYEHLPPDSYSPVQGQRLPREYSPPPIHGQQQQIPFGLQRVYRHSPSLERYLSLPNHRSPHNSSLAHKGGK